MSGDAMVPGYLEHLTGSDVRLLAQATGSDAEPLVRRLRSDLASAQLVLSDPAVFDRLFGASASDPLLLASPFLVFAVIVHRAARDLEQATFVHERTKPRQRVPVFDTGQLRAFLDDPLRRLFLVELLASYTTVASGAVWTRSSRGWRKHRFSELDPVRFASLLDVVPEPERPGVYRRLGDLALFLTGVFPDTALTSLGTALTQERLTRTDPAWRSSHRSGPQPDTPGALALLEHLGQRWYHLACATASPPTATLRVVRTVADHFHTARRVLNVITDDYLFPYRGRWFPTSAT
jgi:hypothetical protein